MRLRILGLAVAGAIAFGGVALAQNVPGQFVVSGKAAEQIQDFNTINLASAERIADVCEKAAVEQAQKAIKAIARKHGRMGRDE